MSERDLFLAAVQKDDPAERVAFLDAACAGDDALRKRVEVLLRAYQDAGSFLDEPAVAEALTGAQVPDSGESSPAAEHPGARIGPYKLLQQLGEGGMGTVWMAEQSQPVRRTVALKVIKAGMDSKQILARFEAERQAIALMDHPSIAKVLETGMTDTGRPFFAMELVKGIPITRYCDEHHLTPRERLGLFISVCKAIQHAHQKGIIHRDIKPSNVLVASYDGKPVPKVIDFGVAKATGQKLTERTMFTAFGNIVGTLEYMSPEQAEFNALDIDTRSDVYGLGVLLYELLTGTTPLSRQRLKETALTEALRLIREEEPPWPSTRLSESRDGLPTVAAHRKTEPAQLAKLVRGELDWVVMKALEKDRARRYETANALARDLERYLSDEAVEACPPSAGYRLRKFARKYKTPLRVAGAFLLLLTAGTVVSAWQAVRAMRAEAAATDDRDRALQAERSARQARAETEKALAESEEARRQSQSVSKYLVEVFRSPDPRQDGRDTRVADLLDRAVADLEGPAFVGPPRVKAEILDALGRTYKGLGMPAKAIEILEKARQLRQQALGPDHPDTLATLYQLAQAYHDDVRFPKAAQILEKVLELRKVRLGPEHPDTLLTMNHLAWAYWGDTRFAQARALLEETLRLQKATLGPEHLDTALTLNRLGVEYGRAGELAAAEKFLKEALRLRKALLGPDHPDTLLTMHNLGLHYTQAKRRGEAIAVFEEASKLQEARLGTDHPSTLFTQRFLAVAYRNAKRLDEAIALLEQVLPKQLQKLRPGHPQIVGTLKELITSYKAAGRTVETLLAYEQLRLQQIKDPGPEHPTTLTTLNKLAAAYEANGEYAKAENLYRDVLKARRNEGKSDPLALAGALASLGNSLLDQKKYPDAEPLLRESLALRQEKAPKVWTTFYTRSLLGGSLLGQGKHAEAEPLLLNGYEGMKQREAKIPEAKARLTEAVERLVQLYEARGQQDKAAAWRLKLKPPSQSKGQVRSR